MFHRLIKTFPARPGLFLLLLTLLPGTAMYAQVVDLDQLPWSINSETMFFDGKTSTMNYTGLRFSQGNISIESENGRASTGDEESRTFAFSGNVVIIVENGRIECDSADLRFDGGVLNVAVVTGSPATFELLRADAQDATRASAGKLLYDVPNGVIQFSDNATITESGNEISSNFIVYDIDERIINADSAGIEDGRVRITYTPTNDAQADDAPEGSTEEQ